MITYNSITYHTDALLYFCNCQLATVVSMAMKKRRTKHEYERQILIAQHMVDYIRKNNITPDTNNRILSVSNFGWSVAEYAKSYEQKI